MKRNSEMDNKNKKTTSVYQNRWFDAKQLIDREMWDFDRDELRINAASRQHKTFRDPSSEVVSALDASYDAGCPIETETSLKIVKSKENL